MHQSKAHSDVLDEEQAETIRILEAYTAQQLNRTLYDETLQVNEEASGIRAPHNTPSNRFHDYVPDNDVNNDNIGYVPPSYFPRAASPKAAFDFSPRMTGDKLQVNRDKNYPQLKPHAAVTEPSQQAANASNPPQANAIAQALLEFHLPRPEQQSFDGSPKNYKAFIASFHANIANKVDDPSLKLTYLIQHCTGDAKKLVKDCVLLPAEVAYDTALTKLERRFGQNHLIARSYIDDITGGAQVKPNDINALVTLSDDMNNCQTVLSQLKFTSDLDASGTLRSIVKRLPNNIQTKWVEKVHDILEKGREPTFKDLSDFIEVRARVASSMYGRDYAAASKSKLQPETKPSKQKPAKTNVSTLSTVVENPQETAKPKLMKERRPISQPANPPSSDKSEKFPCTFCETAGHGIERCFKYKKLSLEDRVEFARKHRLCFCCFKKGHGSKSCDKKCFKCQRRHHVLLHDPSREQKSGMSLRPV